MSLAVGVSGFWKLYPLRFERMTSNVWKKAQPTLLEMMEMNHASTARLRTLVVAVDAP